MTQWGKLPRALRLLLAWGGGGVAVMLPAVYAMQHSGPPIESQSMSTTTVTLLVLVLGAMTAVTAMIGKQYQGLVSTQRGTMKDLEARVAAQDVRIEAQNAKIEKLENDLREARGRHLDAEIKHASELGAAKELARSLEQRIQMLEPLEAKVRVLSEDKKILEEMLREKERLLTERRTGTGGAA